MPLSATKPAVKADRAPSATSPESGIKGRDWISKQDPRHFTVQLISSINEGGVVHFIRKHGIEAEAAYYSILQKGQLWYAVVYGSFPNRNTARHALRQLPPSLRRYSPRIRRFEGIPTLPTPGP